MCHTLCGQCFENSDVSSVDYRSMIGENRQLVTNEPVESEK